MEKKEDQIGEENAKNRMPSFLQTAEPQKASYEDIKQSLQAISDGVLDGMLDEDLSYLQLDTIEKLAKDFKNVIKESVITELNRNDGFMIRGNKVIQVMPGKAMYSFKSNPNYVKLLDDKKRIEAEMKSVTNLLQSQQNPYEIQEDGTVWNPSTGEQMYSAEKTNAKASVKVSTQKTKK